MFLKNLLTFLVPFCFIQVAQSEVSVKDDIDFRSLGLSEKHEMAKDLVKGLTKCKRLNLSVTELINKTAIHIDKVEFADLINAELKSAGKSALTEGDPGVVTIVLKSETQHGSDFESSYLLSADFGFGCRAKVTLSKKVQVEP
jgi:hypothetical protein